MFLDLFFEEIVNLAMKILDSACGTCYTQNSVWGREEQVGWPSLIDFVQSGSKPKFGGDSESGEGNLKFSLCVPIWQNQWFKQEEKIGWLSPIHFTESGSRPKFQEDCESEEGNLKFQLCVPIQQNQWWMPKGRLHNLLQLHSFKECLNPFFEENKNPNTEFQYLACSSWYSQYDLGPWGRGQVTFSDWFPWTWT